MIKIIILLLTYPLRARSLVVMIPPLQGGGHRFKSGRAHLYLRDTDKTKKSSISKKTNPEILLY